MARRSSAVLDHDHERRWGIRGLRVVTLTPWRRGPRQLLRHPATAAALTAAALVAALPAAAAPLFLSSSEHAALHRQLAEACIDDTGVRVASALGRAGAPWPGEVTGRDRADRRDQLLPDLMPSSLAPPRTTLHGEFDLDRVDGPSLPSGQTAMTVLARDDVADHVEVVAGPDGEGLWLPNRYANAHDLEPGDELEVVARNPDPAAWGDQATEPATVRLPVAAVYRDLRDVPDVPAWCGVRDVFRGPPGAEEDPNTTILPTALLDPPTLLDVGEATRAHVTLDQAAPLLDPRPTTGAAARTATDVDALRRVVTRDHPELFPTAFGDSTSWTSTLRHAVGRAALVHAGLRPPVLPITAAGTVTGLAMIVAAAVSWCRRRQRELAVLAAHGAGPTQLGIKAILEAAPAIVLGTIGGWLAAWGLVALVGPSAMLGSGALPRALVVAGTAGVAAMLLTGAVATSFARSLTDQPPTVRGGRWWTRVPWELSLIAAAPVAWERLDAGSVGDLTAGVGTVTHVPARLLVAPLLGLLGASLLFARLAARVLRRRGLSSTPARPARLLAWRRVVRDAGAVAALTAATAVPLAMAAFSATATASIRATDDAALRLALGADAVLTLDRDVGELTLPVDLPAETVQVLRLSRQRVDGRIVDLLGVDPDRFAATAFWDPRLPGPTLTDDLAELSTDPTPRIIASSGATTGTVELAVRDAVTTAEVATTRELPGTRGGRPTFVVDRDVLQRLVGGRVIGREELWVRGDVDAAITAVADTDTGISRQDRVEDRRVGAIHEPVSYTFGYLTALSIFTGLIGAAGLVLHLEARVATHRRSYVLLRRLGLTGRAHRRALLLEVGGPLVLGTVVGLAGAAGAAAGVRAGFDLDPRQPPDAILVLPTGLMATLAAVAVVVAVLAAFLTQARLDRADPAEVLRATD